jgi:hypothetical protein
MRCGLPAALWRSIGNDMKAPVNASTLLLVAANLLPIAGVVWWGWDAFVLLMLYWLETAIIGFWTIVRLIVAPTAVDVSGKPLSQMGFATRIGLGAFIAVHAGIFMSVHFIFLWALFSGDWSSEIDGPGEFVRVMIVGTDLWIPLAFLFLVRGVMVMGPSVRRRLGIVAGAEPEPAEPENPVLGLYIRIVVMQFTIILGAWFALLAGDTVGPLLLLIALKTAVEVFYDRITRHTAEKATEAGEG